MKKITPLILVLIMLFCGNTTIVHAETNENIPDYEVVEEFNIYDNSSITTDTDEPSTIEPRSHISYHVTKLNRTSEVGSYTGQSVSGVPGITVSLSKMEGASYTASSNVKFNVKQKAETTLGFSFTKSYSINHSGSRKIPSTHNGKKVKRAEIKAYVLYDKYNFKVTWTSSKVKNPQYYGTYWAKKPCGYHYKMVYYYK